MLCNYWIGFRWTGSTVETYTSDKFAWTELPVDGWLGFMLYFDQSTQGGVRYRRIMVQSDWYGMIPDPDGDLYINNNNTDNDVRYPTAIWLRGMWAPDAVYMSVQAELISRQRDQQVKNKGCKGCNKV